MKKALLFLLSISYQPGALFLVWIWNVRPFTWISDSLNIDLIKIFGTQNPITLQSALDVALLAWLLNLLLQLLKILLDKLVRPVKVEIKVKDPTDQTKNNSTLYSFAENKSVPLKVECEMEIKWRLVGKLLRLLKSNLTIAWPEGWLSLRIDNSNKYGQSIVKKGNIYFFSPWISISDAESSSRFQLIIFFNVNHDYKTEGSINVDFESAIENKLLKFISNILIRALVKKQLEHRTISLKKN
ncbi:hypothetical protein BSK49_24500 [Paenibacillus odorifer]|uniref:hypothetical protein n=1 Tax=Paenibacillus odorifer TaxID=189426 RepID=UPI00096FBBFF|nr:hypothetical protein [Paenibacillus odorifer]OMD83449.1 hypothetical protein BSK49_24500 [Paenibacillus odorifer]